MDGFVGNRCLYHKIKFVSPHVFKLLSGKDHSMPTLSTLMLWYMILGILGALVYVSTIDLKWASFLSFMLPTEDDNTKKLLQKTIVFEFPLLSGWFVYSGTTLTKS
jgi:hypothetical protein